MFIQYLIIQHYRGHPPVTNVWVFGMVDIANTPALGHMEIVPNKTQTVLLPIIQRHTLPNTTIHTDDFSSYRNSCGMAT